MMIHKILTEWALMVGLLLNAFPVHASLTSEITHTESRIYHLQSQQTHPVNKVFKQWAQADVLYLAETHDRPDDHAAQLEILRSLRQHRPQLVIGMEMFQRPYQTVLNQYIAGKLSEAELVEQTQYSKRWGYPWALYAAILQFAKAHQLPVIALNTPSEVTRKVARAGFDSLTIPDRQWIPPQSEIRLEPDRYRQRVRQIYDEIHQGKGNSDGFERFFLAQVLWDETMAESVSKALATYPNALVVVLAGQGHILYGDGIPNRVARRVLSRSRSLNQVSVVLNPSPELQTERAIADYFWYSR